MPANLFRISTLATAALAMATCGVSSAEAGCKKCGPRCGLFQSHHGKCCGKSACGGCGCSSDFGGAVSSGAGWGQPPAYSPYMTGQYPSPANPGIARQYAMRPLPAVSPPPGTLGQTYRRPSEPILDGMHPRMAMLSVYGVPDAEVAVEGMKGFRGTNGVWHFETERPLVPGLPFIYEVKAQRVAEGAQVSDVRTVRLIPGRIVSLEY